MKLGRLTRIVLAIVFMMSIWGCGSNRDSDGFQTAAQTPESILRATSFVGSDRCGGCHAALHSGSGWADTAHTQKLRDGSLQAHYINDGSASGNADFFDGADVDIKTLPPAGKFDAFGADAPILGSDSNGAYIKIGSDTHYIVFTLGGTAIRNPDYADSIAGGGNADGIVTNAEAQWKQRYITKIGKSHYILPIQYNAQTQEYTTYHPEDWYDTSNVPMVIGTGRSYERRCAGCHVTGLKVKLDVDEWVMSFTDISVACEACHGPGGQHAESPNKDNIINPATMTTTLDLNGDGNTDQIDNLVIRNYVCYACHSRGSGKYEASGSKLAYPSKNQTDSSGYALLYLPSLDWTDYYDISTSGGDYWGGDPTSGEFITSKGHHQQQQDHAFGPHGADKSYDHACFECHDMHDPEKGDNLIAGEIVVDGITVTNPDGAPKNNRLCLACHAGHGDFASITPTQINLGAAAVDTAVMNHMANRAYMKENAAIPGVLTPQSCQDCHMPATAKSAIEGDVKSHAFNIIWPNYVMQPGTFSWNGTLPTPAGVNTPTTKLKKWWESNGDFVDPADGTAAFATVGLIPNSCITSSCHRPETDDDIVTQWYGSGHADGKGEAKDPDGTGEPFNHWNTDDELSASCARCHSMNGYIEHVNGLTVTAQSVVFPKVLGCETCHVPNGAGDTIFEGDSDQTPAVAALVQTVTFPSGASQTLGDNSNICMECHQGRESGQSVADEIAATPGGPHTFINRHYFAAAAILFGTDVTAGYEYPAKVYLGRNTFPAHNASEQTCVGCHMRGTKDHHFAPQLADCSGCHGGIAAFTDINRASAGGADVDYDGDAVAEGFQGEIDTLEAALLAAMQAYAIGTIGTNIGYNAGSYPYFFKDTDGSGVIEASEASFGNRYDVFDDALLAAAFNYHSNQDPCGDIHNHMYVIQTIYDSIEDLGGNVAAFTRP